MSPSSTTTAVGIDRTPLLDNQPQSQSQAPRISRSYSRNSRLRTAARIMRRATSRRMRESSVRVRESAAEEIEGRQSDWAYSLPIVVIDLVWNAILVMAAVVMLVISRDENPSVPLRLWIVGYGIQCILHMICVSVEYARRQKLRMARRDGGDSNLNNSEYLNSSSNSAVSGSEEVDVVEHSPEQRSNNDNTSVAKHLESANTIFGFIWWIIGFYWISSSANTLTSNAPDLYWFAAASHFLFFFVLNEAFALTSFTLHHVAASYRLCIAFLAFDVFFVVICVAMACIIGIAVCFCLPCIIAILYAVADQEGATREEIEQLPKYRFRQLGEIEKSNGEIQASSGGKMIECGSATLIEHTLSAEEAECCICLNSYEDEAELRELPCKHHFHCHCIDKWLQLNATCPLCKFNILKNGQSGAEDA